LNEDLYLDAILYVFSILAEEIVIVNDPYQFYADVCDGNAFLIIDPIAD
jgi:hypothetical protein